MREELKPCPFCGCEAKIIQFLGSYTIHCSKCGGMTDPYRSRTREKAIEAWNRRTKDERPN